MKDKMHTGKMTTKTPMSKATQGEKSRLLHKLAQAAEDARNRVSGYSDEKRSNLEQCARELIKGADPKQVCRTGQ
jgi:hypothetical protein